MQPVELRHPETQESSGEKAAAQRKEEVRGNKEGGSGLTVCTLCNI